MCRWIHVSKLLFGSSSWKHLLRMHSELNKHHAQSRLRASLLSNHSDCQGLAPLHCTYHSTTVIVYPVTSNSVDYNFMAEYYLQYYRRYMFFFCDCNFHSCMQKFNSLPWKSLCTWLSQMHVHVHVQGLVRNCCWNLCYSARGTCTVTS